MHDRAIAVRGCENAANAPRRQISHVMRLLSDRQRQPHCCPNTASFIGRQDTGRCRKCFPPSIFLQPGKNRTAARPTIEPRTADRYGVDESLDHRTEPKTRLQLMPPKPKALLMTVRTERASFCKITRERKFGSSLVTFRQPGRIPCWIHSPPITASRMPEAPSVWPVQPLV